MANSAKQKRFKRGLRQGIKLARGSGKGKARLIKTLEALEASLKDAGDPNITPFELATALARKIDDGVALKGLALPTTPPIPLELLDGPVVFVIALGIVTWWRKHQKQADEEPADAEVDATAKHLEVIGHPDIGELPEV